MSNEAANPDANNSANADAHGDGEGRPETLKEDKRFAESDLDPGEAAAAAEEENPGRHALRLTETMLLASVAQGPHMTIQQHHDAISTTMEDLLDAMEGLVAKGMVVEDPQDESDAGLQRALARLPASESVLYLPTGRGRHQLRTEYDTLMGALKFMRESMSDKYPVYRGTEAPGGSN